MNGKTIGVGVIIIIIVAIGAYIIVKNPFSAQSGAQAPAAQTATSTAASSANKVQAQDVTVGTGTPATPGSHVSVLYVGYVGKISTSTIFDSSAAHGNKPLTFTLGSNGMIPGFQIGVNGMKVGGERLMAIPPALGYGGNAVHQNPSDPTSPVVIPASSTLIFDVKLVDVQQGSSTPATTPAQTTSTSGK